MSYFTTYLDDSGTDPNQRVAISTALIIPANRIVALESEWDTLKKKEGFTDFHTSEFVARNYKSEFAKWDDDKQCRVFRRVRQIIKKYGTKIYSFAVHKKDYDEVVPEKFRKLFGNHYTWAIRHNLSHLVAWRVSRKVKFPLQYMFDWAERNDPARKEIETVMEQAEKAATQAGYGNEYLNYDFRRRKDHAGLQCVDAVGWTGYQLGMHAFCGTPLHPFSEAAWNDFMSGSRGDVAGLFEWFTAMSVSRDDLKTYIESVLGDDKVLSRFLQWEKEKNENKKPRIRKV